MPFRRTLPLALASACAVLAACGDSVPAARCTPAPSAAPPSVVAGPLTARADRSEFPAGGTLRISIDATGPARYNAPCDQPLQVIVVDSADLHVAALSAPAPKGTPCGAVTLAAGQTAHYELLWTADPTLPPGRYTLATMLGDQAALVVPVELGLPSLTCP
jgi:ABC-type amino acid transport substrate-binding protein